ncbi:AMP-binding protein [Pseudoalteromonas sp. McH1-7]|uniref:AMP-binding protein n=1 Tax=Pseudoalteromonas sp. McH1-7 TaxID=2745574 RepID=UPI0015920205|nr:AMP-binding protein [Pseudoalteromonas sp. McH1-7]NUZ09578.1 AMP-binding protein [Pseudoalteromonas sp. McH1-7]
MSKFWALGKASNSLIVDGERTLNYSQLDTEVQSALSNLPKKKQLIAIVAHNSLPFVIHYLAALRGGHTVLLLDKSKGKEQHQVMLTQFHANYLIDGDLVSHLNPDTVTLAPEIALLLGTSGTTGREKVVKLTFENLTSNCAAITQVLPISKTDCAMASLPFSYSFGLSILHSHLLVGAGIILGQESLMSKSFWQQFTQHNVNSFYGVPFSFEMLFRLGLQRQPLHQLKYMAQAGGRLSGQLWEALKEFCGAQKLPFYAMYGQTEATARMAIMQPDDFLAAPAGAIGKTLPFCKLYIANGEKEGELCFEGANIFAGYASSLEDLRECEVSAILKTGDVAHQLDNGMLQIIGRIKRIAKLEGRRINLDDLERQLNQQFNLSCVITSDDKQLRVFICGSVLGVEKQIAQIAQCHHRNVKVFNIETIPRLSNGKVNYNALI